MGYISGKTIKELREKRKMTQKELAKRINVSDKTVSKWETEKGLPDIAIIEDLSKELGASITELLTGDMRINKNISSNMEKIGFYVCPICGNVIMAVGEGLFSCCGITLHKQEPEKLEENHTINVETVDDEYYVYLNHAMEKTHYISFVAYLTLDSCEIVKLYPEQGIAVRFKKKGNGKIYAFCNKHGMFYTAI